MTPILMLHNQTLYSKIETTTVTDVSFWLDQSRPVCVQQSKSSIELYHFRYYYYYFKYTQPVILIINMIDKRIHLKPFDRFVLWLLRSAWIVVAYHITKHFFGIIKSLFCQLIICQSIEKPVISSGITGNSSHTVHRM